MKKWGVRLISAFFLFGAVTNYLEIITKTDHPIGFLGTSFRLYAGWTPETLTSQLNIMALIGLCINLYIAYNLLIHRDQGRIWALVILWLSIIISVVWFVRISFTDNLSPTEIFLKFDFFNYFITVPFLAWMGAILLFYAIQIYFLMRKDIKADFQRQETVEVKPAIE